MNRSIPFRGGILSVVEVPLPYDINRTGVEFALWHDGAARRFYVPPGQCPVDQVGLDRLPEDVLWQWWYAASVGRETNETLFRPAQSSSVESSQ